MEKILIKYSQLRDTEDNLDNITKFKCNIISQITVTFYYFSYETNPRFVAITVLEFIFLILKFRKILLLELKKK